MPDKIQFLCSCHDYLSGTAKYSKKKSTCKRCKGIKLPLVPIGGTVRMLPPPMLNPVGVQRFCAATVRLPSSAHGSRYANSRRPTILSGDRDPYDFLRQSRLLYDEPQRSSDPLNRNFMLGSASQPGYFYDAVSAPMVIADGYREPFGASSSKLPYELISSTLHSNEFSPVYDVPSRKSVQSSASNGLKRVQSRKEERKVAEPKQKSILKQPIVPIRLSAPADVFRDEPKASAKQTHLTCAATTSESVEKRNQSASGMSNGVKPSTISGIRSSKSFSGRNPVAKSLATLTGRNKKVQFTEANSDSEKESENAQHGDVQTLENGKEF